MDGLPNVGAGGLLRDIYRDLRNIIIVVFNILLFIPKPIYKRIGRKWELRQHRRNIRRADPDEIWGDAKQQIKRRLKSERRFLYYEHNALTTVSLAEYIERALETARMTSEEGPLGTFVLCLQVSQFYVSSELFDEFKAIVNEEITRVFNRHFELELEILDTERFLRSVIGPLVPKITTTVRSYI